MRAAKQDHVQAMCAESAASPFSLSLVYGNLPTKSLHVVSHIIFVFPTCWYIIPVSSQK